uniref:Uncharacterized protein n=1 Tax=Magallana gigas TaxID=29159 RepID=A0A8W8IWY6_MAGGI
MTETSSSHVGEERAFHAAPRGSQHGPIQDSMDDFTTAEALDIFSDKLERALRRQKQEIVNELNLTSKSTEKKYGWDFVQEYQDDPITDDADDATKLRQAIFRAKKRNDNKKPYERNNRSYSGQDS